MIRGCGLEGLKSMDLIGSILGQSSINGKKEFTLIRPFLLFSREDILDYAQKKQLKWLEDPSNFDETFLRNWLRKTWLMELEKKRPGGRFRLGQSLAQVASSFSKKEDSLSKSITSEGIPRNLLMETSLIGSKKITCFVYEKTKY